MELRDYLRMIRRGWPTLLLVTILVFITAGAYLALAPRRYESTATLLLSAADVRSVTDLSQSSQWAINNADTYAGVIDSAVVLGPASERVRPTRSVADLEAMVTPTARESTALIDITVSAHSAEEAANIANTVATTALQVVPPLAPLRSSTTVSTIKFEVVRDAPMPTSALSPNPKRIAALALVVGLALGLGVTIATQALDTRLRRPEDLRALAALPVLAILPRVRRAQRNSLVLRDDRASPAVEVFRSLRTNLSYLEGGRSSVLVAGVSRDREGAQVPVNLAWSIAQAGRRVLLIDLDLRQSAVGDLLRLRSQLGLADVLGGRAELADVVMDSGQPGLSVLLSGTSQASPSDLLSTLRMVSTLAAAESAYDYVVLHAPPILTYTDAAVVSRIVGYTVVDVTAGHTRATSLMSALGVLNNVQVKPLGLILSGSRKFVVGDSTKVRPIWSRGREQGDGRSRWDWHAPDDERASS